MFLQLFMILILARTSCVLCDDPGSTLVTDATDGPQVNGYGDIENLIKELVITTSNAGERKDAAIIESTKRPHQRTRRRPIHQTGIDYDDLESVLEVLFHRTSENGENNALHTSLEGDKAAMTSVAPLMKGPMSTQNSNVEDDIHLLTVFPESHGGSVTTDTNMEDTTNKKSEETDIPFSERSFEISFKLWHVELIIFCLFVLILCVISAIFLCEPACLRGIRSKRDSMYIPLTDVSDDASDDDDLLIINFSKRTDEYRNQCRVDFMGLDPESIGTVPFNLGREIENTSISIADEPLSRLPGSFSAPPSSTEEKWRQSNQEFEALIESIPGRFTFLDE